MINEGKINTVGIIGFGRFGKLAASIFKKHTQAEVKVYHYKNKTENVNAAEIIGAKLVDFKEAAECDLVIFSVPISKTEAVVKEAAEFVKKGALIIDTCSVKVYPCQWLSENLPEEVEIMGTHPMFGPESTKFNLEKQEWSHKGLQLILCPLRISSERLTSAKAFLEKIGLEVIETTPEDHDKQNAITLSLVHYLGRSLWDAGIRDQKIFTPGFKNLLKIYEHTIKDTWQLLYDMNNYNPYAKEIRARLMRSLREVETEIEEAIKPETIEFYRNLIDSVDFEILRLLERRYSYVHKIGLIKKEKGLPIFDPKREAEMYAKRTEQSKLDKKFIKKLLELITAEAKRLEK